MLRSLITGRVVTALVVGGILALAQLSGPATVTVSPAIDNVAEYPDDVVTETDVWVNRQTMRPGQSNTAHARVTSEAGSPPGTVTFRVQGYGSQTVPLVRGRASYDLPRDLEAGRTYRVSATYNGQGVYKSSSDETYVTVTRSGRGNVGNGNGNDGGGSDSGGGAGDDGGNGDGGNGDGGNGGGNGSGDGSANRPGAEAGGSGTAGSGGDLPATGSDENTMLYTLVGVGLLALGGATFLARRRFTS